MTQVLALLFAAGFTYVVSLSTGKMLLDGLCVRLYRSEEHFFGFVLGAALLSTAVFALTAAHLAYTSAFLTLGECYYAQNQKPKALECFLKVTALYYVNAPAVSDALYWSGVVFEETNNLPRAAGQYKDFLKTATGSPRADDAKTRLQKVEAKLPKDDQSNS